MLGQMSPIEDATLNRALVLTYRQKGITENPATPSLKLRAWKISTALSSVWRRSRPKPAARLERYVMGAIKGIFDQQSNINLDSKITVFTLRELADEIPPHRHVYHSRLCLDQGPKRPPPPPSRRR